MENEDILKKGLEIYGIDAGSEIIEKFKIYMDTLLEWNKKINLTAITEPKEIIEKHFLDSVSCLEAGIDFMHSNVIDVGTGAGFPGIPLKIVVNDMRLTLLDSLNKRVIFLTELMNRLGLDCSIIHGRAEDYGVKPDYREIYDIALSRAVAPMNILSEYTLPFVKVGGSLLCLKGPSIDEEIVLSKKAINILGGEIDEVIETKVFGCDLEHRIVKIKKVKLCPGKYPRKAGVVEKKPIV